MRVRGCERGVKGRRERKKGREREEEEDVGKEGGYWSGEGGREGGGREQVVGNGEEDERAIGHIPAFLDTSSSAFCRSLVSPSSLLLSVYPTLP